MLSPIMENQMEKNMEMKWKLGLLFRGLQPPGLSVLAEVTDPRYTRVPRILGCIPAQGAKVQSPSVPVKNPRILPYTTP